MPAQVTAVYERAHQQVKAGRLAEAHESLEQVRDSSRPAAACS
jgi:hypothetical protein